MTFRPASHYINDSLHIDADILVSALPYFDYIDGVLHIDGVSSLELAKQYGTPSYVYSQRAILDNYQAYSRAFASLDHQICYAVKTNSNLAVLKSLAQIGAGFDIVSKGELARVLQVTDGKKVVYSGVGKTADDIEYALNADICCFNVEAVSELDTISQVATRLNKTARISLRINPDVDAKTHPYISTGLKSNKFGISHQAAVQAYLHAKQLPYLQIVGIDCHIGSQLIDIQGFSDALDKLIELIDELKSHGIHLEHIDLGGGLGVRYIDENPASVDDFAKLLLPRLRKLGLKLYLEPGRSLLANAGVLLSRVDVLKPTEFKNFAIIDASMSELIRPALYEAVMAIIPTDTRNAREIHTWDIVGSVCESSDFLGKDRACGLQVGDILAITGAGAYGFSMACNYNSRPRPCEVMVDDGSHRLIRKRESLADLWRDEII
ncbi:diaminopimelate decarboxylase [Moraxella cuniculi DSM 21768]|uniref:Diaminopimelate decarboxylase n=1 Tax=Moraxella cuniculi DSM 21768 TaxID=1122245 RepID=A0A1N7FNZ4_9GAMM|nr:diaminopimelate decarboxylase [Moraxella cuniculi]OOS04740.1 diaminopimelate decarboxylase [Moraxella cuniculi]SIS02082.1 diaminopimelate decarboxylase [Moraxella cuniculi DSM 21768]